MAVQTTNFETMAIINDVIEHIINLTQTLFVHLKVLLLLLLLLTM